MSKTTCPCGGQYWDVGPADGTRCTKCGRTMKRWSNAPAEWIEDPVIKRLEEIRVQFRGHLLSIERRQRRLERLFLEKYPRPKRKKAKP